MKIYTRTGDSGETGLFGGERRQKNDRRVATYGTVDEANAILGVAALTAPGELSPLLQTLQAELFTLGADLATPLSYNSPSITRITDRDIARLEGYIDAAEATLPPLTQFILPGGHPCAASLHHARTVVRRAERELVALIHDESAETNHKTLIYLNRLSDLLFVLARQANHLNGVSNVPWTSPL